jgi:hypothetical protein
MKRILIISLFTLFAVILSPLDISAQQTGTTTAATVEKKDIKALEEQLKLKEEQLKADIVVRTGPEFESRRGVSVISGDDFGYWPSQQGGYSFSSGSRSQNMTSLDFSRSVTDNSSVKEYTFEVEKEMKRISLSISGACKTGEVRISILMPGNKAYSDVVIDEFGSMNWKKSFELNDESKDKIGIWKFKVTTTKATGNFRLSLQGS